MTEKRFKVVQGYNDRYCQDTATNKLLNQNQTVEYLNELNDENNALKQYKQSVNDVLTSWSQKNLTAKQLQVVIAIMEELNVL